MTERDRLYGTIVRLLPDKGFGFIQGRDGVQYFVHRSDVEGDEFRGLTEGATVSFVSVPSAKGPRAEQVARA